MLRFEDAITNLHTIRETDFDFSDTVMSQSVKVLLFIHIGRTQLILIIKIN